jgi:septal ring factor EnvC (AmiA/AmiB activator)
MEASGLLRYEVDELKKWRQETEQWRRHVDDDRRDLTYLRTDVADLTKAFNSLRRMLLTFALSIAGSAIIFALSILIATRRLP